MFFVPYRIAFWWTVRHQFSGSGLQIKKNLNTPINSLKKTVLFVLYTDIRFFIKTNPIKTTDRLILHNDMPDLKTILLSVLLTIGHSPFTGTNRTWEDCWWALEACEIRQCRGVESRGLRSENIEKIEVIANLWSETASNFLFVRCLRLFGNVRPAASASQVDRLLYIHLGKDSQCIEDRKQQSGR